MKISFIATIFLTASCMQACNINSTEGQGSLLSDGYISYSINGTSFIAHDSLMAGDPSNFELSGFDLDSSLRITGRGIRFFVEHCFDTGRYLLSVDSTLDAPSADVLFEDTVWSDYATDSIHVGELHITQFNLTKKNMAGTFTFLAHKPNASLSDTVRVVSGILYNFPLNRN
jgi:hypothetical protein